MQRGSPDMAASAESGWLRTVDVARLLDCFGTTATRDVVEAMRSHPRFAPRLESLVRDRFRLGGVEDGASLDVEADRSALALDRAGLDALAERCGLVVWSASLAREIRRPVVGALMERFGEPAFRAAIAERDLSLEPRPIESVDQLALDVARDGQACMAAWIAVLPPGLRDAIALRWPTDAEMPARPADVLAARGPLILRRVLAVRERDGLA